MDPNATLTEILNLVTPIVEARSPLFEDADAGANRGLAALADLADNIFALNEWITHGGFLPAAWVTENHRYEARESAATSIVNKVIAGMRQRGFVIEPDDNATEVFGDADVVDQLATANTDGDRVLVLVQHGFLVTHRA